MRRLLENSSPGGPAPSKRSRARLSLVLALVALACGGCRLDLLVEIDLDRSGGGSLAAALSADAELRRLADQAGADPLDELVRAGDELRDEGWTTQDRGGADGERTVTLSATFDDSEDFNRLAEDLAEALAADEAELLEPLRLQVDDDHLTLRGVAAARPRRAVADYGLTRGQVVRLLRRRQAFGYEVRVTVPGEVVTTSASHADGHTVSWQVPPGRRVSVDVVSTRPGPPWLRAVLGSAAGALLAAFLLWLVTRRSRSAARAARGRPPPR